MNQITVRNIPAAVESRLRTMADRLGLSLDQTVIRLLEAATGGRADAEA